MTLVALTWFALPLADAPPGDSKPQPAGGPWRFVLPPPGDPFEHPPFRALVLSREKPEDVSEKVVYRGPSRRYGQIRFGSPGSIRVTVVLDEVGPGDVDLFVDANRDRKIDDRDRVAGTNGSAGRELVWRVPLDVAMVEGEVTKTIPRALIFRLGATGRTLAYAAAGYIEGTVLIDGSPRTVRRMDGDGNGIMTDAQDRIWIDLDRDGQWDAASEQFLYSSILNLNGGRYVLRSDLLGTRLALERLVGTGTVQLALKKGTATDLRATLVGRDGSAFGLSGNEPATVPVGEYRLSTVTATLDDPQGGESWSYIFSDNGGKPDPKWYAVAKNQQVPIDPIGSLEMGLNLAERGKPIKAGEDLSVRPALYTGDGLLINAAYRGTPTSAAAQERLGALTTLATTDGQTLSTAHSGFV